jgi:hypothetical protein
MIRIRYAISVLFKSDLVDAKLLGNDARFALSMELRERIDAMGPSKIDRWVVGKRLDYC